MIMLEYQNTKIFLLKDILQVSLKEFLWLKKVENTFSWTYVFSDLDSKKIIGTFYEKELPKIDNSFNSWIDKKDVE